jgi:hypothetical protein
MNAICSQNEFKILCNSLSSFASNQRFVHFFDRNVRKISALFAAELASSPTYEAFDRQDFGLRRRRGRRPWMGAKRAQGGRGGRRGGGCVLRVPVADNCAPNPEHLMADENLADLSDIHVVIVDDPLVLVVPDCGPKTTTCRPK